jgi:hypothetical protein
MINVKTNEIKIFFNTKIKEKNFSKIKMKNNKKYKTINRYNQPYLSRKERDRQFD